jgi:transposase InsO family protein
VGEGVDAVIKYAFIDAHRAEFSVVDLCRVGGVSTSGFYDWQARQTAGPSEAEQLEADLVAEIREIHARSRSAYGCPRVVGALRQQGRRVNHKRVERLMALHGIRGRCGRRRLRTTIRDPHARPATDLVNRCFDRQRLNELWVGDITYIPTGEGWLYMSSVLDACSRRLLGWSLAGHMRTELVADALAAAVGQRGGRHRIRGVVFHGDHGSQYTSDDYRKLCRRFGITQSMGTVGDSYDNAMAESFWASLKRELVDWSHFATHAEARAAVFEWINWYNHQRLHTSLQMQSPHDFEQTLKRPLLAA